MRSTEINAYAKINLILNVSERRADGFHEVETLMQGVSLADKVKVFWDELGSASMGEAGAYGSDLELTLDCGDSELSCGSDNLAYKAAVLMHAEFHSNVTERIDIEIEKRIPVAAGLAGGSADGAAVITGLARLWGLLPEAGDGSSENWAAASDGAGEAPDSANGISDGANGTSSASGFHGDRSMLERLCRVAAELGSDVPFSFMLQNGLASAIGRGRGTELEAAESRPMDLVLYTPDCPVSTKEVYAAFDSIPKPERACCEGYLGAAALSGALSFCGNGLRPAAISICPEIAEAEEAMKEAFPDALMIQLSGSGPTIYAVFEEGCGPDAERLCRLKNTKFSAGMLNAARSIV